MMTRKVAKEYEKTAYQTHFLFVGINIVEKTFPYVVPPLE